MTTRAEGPEPPDGPTSTLKGRLTAGVGAVTDHGREAIGPANDEDAWTSQELRRLLAEITTDQLRQRPPEPTRAEFLEYLVRNHHTVRALLHHPDTLLDLLPSVLGGSGSEQDDIRHWQVFAVCADILWEYISSDAPGAHGHRHLLPFAARTRFLALSEPFRLRDSAMWNKNPRYGALAHVFGHESWVELVRRAEEARDVWRGQLNRYQSIPHFDQASPSMIEDEVRFLAFESSFSGQPLVLAQATSTRTGLREVPPADRAVLEETVEQHLLPRFATGRAWAAVAGWGRGPWYRGPLILFGLTGVTVLAAVTCAVVALAVDGLGFLPGVIAAALAYVLVGVGTVAHGRFWAMPLMLRLPAAAAVGLIVLVALHPDWWRTVSLDWRLAGLFLLLVGASFGYLLVEARNHNSGQPRPGGTGRWRDPGRVVGRAASVAATGFVHSLLVALLGMAVIAPIFSEGGCELTAVWYGSQASPAGCPAPETAPDPLAILLAATAWCLAAGVFSQILWDDQPITAPLAHRRWRNER